PAVCATVRTVPHQSAPTPPYTLLLHDALPISAGLRRRHHDPVRPETGGADQHDLPWPSGQSGVRYAAGRNCPGLFRPHEVSVAGDRKSTRLNSSHVSISYAVFCLKKKDKIH